MAQFVRAFFHCEYDESANVMMDLLINDSRKIIPSVQMFGFWGKVSSSELWPFVFHHDELDFGEQCDPNDPDDKRLPREERYGDLDIADRIIAEGEKFTIRYLGQSWDLKLTKVTDILKMPLVAN